MKAKLKQKQNKANDPANKQEIEKNKQNQIAAQQRQGNSERQGASERQGNSERQGQPIAQGRPRQ